MGDRGDDVGGGGGGRVSPARVFLAALLVLSQSADLARTARLAGGGDAAAAPAVDVSELRRNIIRGLKLERLPDMDKVDIGNDEFHCKYLEYFRRLYADESARDSTDGPRGDDATSAAADYDNDVSAILVRGRATRRGRSDDDGPSPTDGRDGDETTTVFAFPLGRAMVPGGPAADRVTVLKSVVRIHGDADRGKILVHGRAIGGGPSERSPWSPVAELTWPRGGGRWKDVDVTRLLRQPRWRRRRRRRERDADDARLELSLRYAAHGAAVDAGRPEPVLHVFLDGAPVDGGGTAARCPGVGTKRRKRDGGGRRKRRKPPPEYAGRARRTDCRTDGNGTETSHHGGGGGGNKCCREQMRVVFADIPGFDFIVEPKWFDAGLCRGRCPAKYNPATRHAFIQSLLWKQHNTNNGHNNDDDDGGGGGGDDGRRPAAARSRRRVRHRNGGPEGSAAASPQQRAPPKPCCAPSKLDRLQIIHVDEADPSALKVTTWKEMSVVECACS